MKKAAFTLIGIVASVFVFGAEDANSNYSKPLPPIKWPKDGYVPDAATALKIAEAVMLPIFGKERIDAQKPFTVRLGNSDVWVVEGTWPPSPEIIGGKLLVRIAKQDGRVLDVIRWK